MKWWCNKSSYLGTVNFVNLTCILAVGLNEVFVGSASKLTFDSFPDLGSSWWFPFRLFDFFGFVELYGNNNYELPSRSSIVWKYYLWYSYKMLSNENVTCWKMILCIKRNIFLLILWGHICANSPNVNIWRIVLVVSALFPASLLDSLKIFWLNSLSISCERI